MGGWKKAWWKILRISEKSLNRVYDVCLCSKRFKAILFLQLETQ